MGVKRAVLYTLFHELAATDFMALLPSDLEFDLRVCETMEEVFDSLEASESRSLIAYELPQTLEIPDNFLQQHSQLSFPVPVICLGSEYFPLSDDSYELLIEFLVKSELRAPLLQSTIRSLFARYDAKLSLKNSKDQLQLVQQELQSLQIGAGIAHDANNMLSATIGHLQLLSSLLPPQQEDRLAEHVKAALQGCQHISYLLNEWSNSSKGTELEKAKEPLSLRTLLTDLKTIVSPLIPKKIDLQIDLPKEATIKGVRYQLEQVFLNLIINAVQAMSSQGKITVSVNFDRDRNGTYAAISVKDTGEGISPDRLSNIFNPFVSSKGDEGGTGLGLAMVNQIIHEHLGHISVESILGVGSCFTVRLPLVEKQKFAEINHMEEHQKKDPQGQVLVIDDTTSLLEIMEDFLGEYGLPCQAFSDPSDALEWSEKHTEEIDMIVLDMKLPGISGKQCFYHLKEMLPAVPILIYSGIVDEEVEELLENGAARFIQKPLDYDEAIRWIKDTVEKESSP